MTMSDQEIARMLGERMKEIAREIFQEVARDYADQSRATDNGAAKLREQLALIKAKEHVTVKEAALLLSCSESHIRKLVKLARKGEEPTPNSFRRHGRSDCLFSPRSFRLGQSRTADAGNHLPTCSAERCGLSLALPPCPLYTRLTSLAAFHPQRKAT
jgi:hypothetical protein